ncbi:uncharacterized protein VTP21DRAFT_8792 [Calcarisporiella thermophila]|uniref:uncharacterized protein n=1 Tax=Calcarisporiella thermophila TaxID=911321 RepID=UPI0037440AEB
MSEIVWVPFHFCQNCGSGWRGSGCCHYPTPNTILVCQTCSGQYPGHYTSCLHTYGM